MLSREEIMQQMEQKIKDLESQKCTEKAEKQVQDCNTTKYWENTSKDFLDNEVFKRLHKIRNNNTHYYYISNYGRVLVAFDKVWKFKDRINSKEELPTICEIIPVKNGYLTKKQFEGVDLNTTTDVYNFMIEAEWWKDEDILKKAGLTKEDLTMAEKIVKYNIDSKKYSNDRIELHHIDNNSSNNSLKNLIWVPRSIHQNLPSN